MKLTLGIIMSFLLSCSSTTYKTKVKSVDIDRFMGDWYVLAGRFTMFETDVHNGIESYTWNEKENRIDIDFTYRKGSFQGEKKSFPQKGYIYNKETNAHWKVSPFWPLKFDYLIIDIADDYSWVAIGVPSTDYLWIMARDYENAVETISLVQERLKAKNYPANKLEFVPHKYD